MIDRECGRIGCHIDVMDGVFVPNISFGFPVLKAIRKATATCPRRASDDRRARNSYVARFAEAGADRGDRSPVQEAAGRPRGLHRPDPRRRVSKARRVDRPGHSGRGRLRGVLPQVDLVLVHRASNPARSAGRRSFPASLEKIAQLRAFAARRAGHGDDHRGRRRHFDAQRCARFTERAPTCSWPATPSSAPRTRRPRS